MTQPDNQRLVTYDVFTPVQTSVTALTADTGWLNSGVSIANGTVTVSSYGFRAIGQEIYFRVFGTWNVAITVVASGDIANSNVFTVSDTRFNNFTQTQGGFGTHNSGRTVSGYVNVGGGFYVTAVGGSTNIAVGDPFSLAGSYLLG